MDRLGALDGPRGTTPSRPFDGLGRGRPPVDECELRAPVLGRQAEISIFFGLTRNGMKFMVFSFRAVISGTRVSFM